MQDADGVQQRLDNQGRRRVQRTHLVLGDALRERGSELRREGLSCLLVDRTEDVFVPISAAEAKRRRLTPAAALDRGETTGKARKIGRASCRKRV